MSDNNDSKEFPCKICYEQFSRKWRYPVSLHCGHTICRVCARKMAGDNQNSIQCCFCRKNTYANWSRLGKNIAFCEMLECANQLEDDENRTPTEDERMTEYGTPLDDFGVNNEAYLVQGDMNEILDEIFTLEEQSQNLYTDVYRRICHQKIRTLTDQLFSLNQQMNTATELFAGIKDEVALLRARINRLQNGELEIEEGNENDEVEHAVAPQSDAAESDVDYDWNGPFSTSETARLQALFASDQEEDENEASDLMTQPNSPEPIILVPLPSNRINRNGGSSATQWSVPGPDNWLETETPYGDVRHASGGHFPSQRIPAADRQQPLNGALNYRENSQNRGAQNSSLNANGTTATTLNRCNSNDCRCRVPWHRHQQQAPIANATDVRANWNRYQQNYWASINRDDDDLEEESNGWGPNALVNGNDERREHDYDQNRRFLNTFANGRVRRYRRRRQGPRVRRNPLLVNLDTTSVDAYRPKYIECDWGTSSDGWSDNEDGGGQQNDAENGGGGEGTSAGSSNQNSPLTDRREQNQGRVREQNQGRVREQNQGRVREQNQGRVQRQQAESAQNSAALQASLAAPLTNVVDNSDAISLFSLGAEE